MYKYKQWDYWEGKLLGVYIDEFLNFEMLNDELEKNTYYKYMSIYYRSSNLGVT